MKIYALNQILYRVHKPAPPLSGQEHPRIVLNKRLIHTHYFLYIEEGKIKNIGHFCHFDR